MERYRDENWVDGLVSGLATAGRAIVRGIRRGARWMRFQLDQSLLERTIRSLQEDRRNLLSRLGEEIYARYEIDEMSLPDMEDLCERVAAVDEKIAIKELDRVKRQREYRGQKPGAVSVAAQEHEEEAEQMKVPVRGEEPEADETPKVEPFDVAPTPAPEVDEEIEILERDEALEESELEEEPQN